jgi:hypothetical protein
MDISQDNDTLFRDFGKEAIYNNNTITVLYENGSKQWDAMEGTVKMTSPTILVKSDDVNDIRQKDIISISGKEYKVKDFYPDDMGLTVVELSYD